MRPRLSVALPALAVWLAAPAPAAAQQSLTLDAAVADALAANPALRAAAARADQAGAEADAAGAAWFPELTVAETWERSNQPVFAFGALLSARAFTAADFDVARLNDPGAVSLMTARVAVRQALFDPRRGATHRAGLARHEAARAALDERRAALVIEVTRAYGRLLAARAADAAATAAASAAREDVLRAERRRDAGLATDADVLAFSVHAAAVERRRIAAAGDAAVSRAALNRLTGQPIDRPVHVSEPSLPAAESRALADLLRDAQARRPELGRRSAERRAAEAERSIARAAWLPRVNAEAGFQSDGLDRFDRAGSWIVGGDVAWTLSLGGAERARARAAAAAVSAAEAVVEDTRLTIHLDVVAALAALDSARAQVEAGRRALADATERERITRNRYEAGLAGATDVLAAAAATLDASAGEVAALVDATIARAELDRALGLQPGDVTP
jgi:outer membrane protein TolC